MQRLACDLREKQNRKTNFKDLLQNNICDVIYSRIFVCDPMLLRTHFNTFLSLEIFNVNYVPTELSEYIVHEKS